MGLNEEISSRKMKLIQADSQKRVGKTVTYNKEKLQRTNPSSWKV